MERDAIQEPSPAQEVRAAPGRGQDLQPDLRRVEPRDGKREASRTRHAEGQAERQIQGQGQAQVKMNRRRTFACPFVAWPPSSLSLSPGPRSPPRQRQSPT